MISVASKASAPPPTSTKATAIANASAISRASRCPPPVVAERHAHREIHIAVTDLAPVQRSGDLPQKRTPIARRDVRRGGLDDFELPIRQREWPHGGISGGGGYGLRQ